MTAWLLAYDGYDPAEEGRREALCALGNGYFATRGAASESSATGTHYPGTYAAGCYNRLRDVVDGRVIESESLVNLPNWLPLTFAVGDGEWFDLDRVELLDYRQQLDLRRGVLTRSIRFRDRVGRSTRVTQRRFVHMEMPHLAGLETTIIAEDWAGPLRIRSGITGAVANAGVERYRQLSGQHLHQVATKACGPETILLSAETTQSHIRVATAARTRLTSNEGPCDTNLHVVREPGSIAHEIQVDVQAGDQITVEKVVSLFTARDRAVSEASEAAIEWLGRAPSFDDLLERHVLAWHHLWRRFDVDFTINSDKADDEALRTVRLHLFHVLQTVSPNSVDLDAGVPARGLHGEAYRGHVFWDELFVFPVLTLRLPQLTRAVLRYRYRRLPEARRAAAEAGLAGAMYPWQSGSDGREESPQIHLNPLSGHWMPDVSHRQRHVGSAVAHTVWRYYESTADLAFLGDYGAEIILEIARFWASITTYDRVRDRYVIRGVMGPDEFHTGYPDAPHAGIDNNAYTNVMAVWVLRRALDVLGLLPTQRRTELTESLRLRAEERERWEDITRKMFVPFHEDGVLSQFEGYEHLTELDWDRYRSQYGNIQRLDRILEAEGLSANAYKVSKQADVLMLFYLLSAEELRELLKRLRYRLPPETIPKTIEYYMARTSHGSTLSALVHAWTLARANRGQALDYFQQLLRSDVADIQGGTTAEGIHLAAMAGSVDLLQRCFTGLETRGDALWFNPRWPQPLGALQFALCYRGCQLAVRITSTRIRVSSEPGPGQPVRIICSGKTHHLAPGEAVEIAVPASPREPEPRIGAGSPTVTTNHAVTARRHRS